MTESNGQGTPERPPLRPVRLGSRETGIERRGDGSILLWRKEMLARHPQRMSDRLLHWAAVAPDRPYLGHFPQGKAVSLSYAEVLRKVRALGQALLDLGLSQSRPLAVLSGNDLDHALLNLAAQHVGVPLASISPSYALLAKDHSKLRGILESIAPGAVFVSDGAQFASALAGSLPPGTTVIARGNLPEGALGIDQLADTSASDAVEVAREATGPDTIARILCTSGSTGQPKPVVLPQRMLTANQQGLAQALPFLTDAPPVLVDWLPWHHTFGGTNNFGMALWNGGTFWIDTGKPAPGLIDATLNALRQVSPTVYFSAPRAFELLFQHLEADEPLRRSFFHDLKLMEYGGSTMPAHVANAYDRLSAEVCGERVLMMSGIGSTEAGPSSVIANWDIGARPIIGLPAAGITAKLAPMGEKLELRLKGPSITPGYLRRPDLDEAAFDDEGYFRMGDGVFLADPEDPSQGLVFDGRTSENFKLSTGTWVTAGVLRDALIAALAPLAADCVIVGEGRDMPAALVFPNLAACRKLAPHLTDAGAVQLVGAPEIQAAFAQRLEEYNRSAGGNSMRVVRLCLESDPPLLDTGELTEKNSISPAVIIGRRKASLGAVFADDAGGSVIAAPA